MPDLESVIPVIIEKIGKYRHLYQHNETAVRNQIIDPILRSIGWNPENPDDVQPNLSTDDGIPDYTLLKDGKKILFIEAKKLNKDIEHNDVLSQLAKYSFIEGTKYGVLTNGQSWLLIRSFKEGTSLKERIIWKINIESDDLHEIFVKFKTISKNNIENIDLLIEKANVLDRIWASFIEEPDELVKGLTPVIKTTLIRNYPAYKFDDSEIEDMLKEKIRCVISPSILIENSSSQHILSTQNAPVGYEQVQNLKTSWFPKKMYLTGDCYDIRHANEILANTANWLMKKGKLKPQDCPIVLGRGTRYLINIVPKHSTGTKFFTPKLIHNGLWLETNCNSESCILYSKRLLEKYGYSHETLKLE